MHIIFLVLGMAYFEILMDSPPMMEPQAWLLLGLLVAGSLLYIASR